MRIASLLIAVSVTGCALVDALSGSRDDGRDGNPDPDTTDADTGQCELRFFEGPFAEPTSASNPTTVAIGNFDGDAFLDLAVGESTGIEFMFGNGSGGFERKQLVPNGVSRSFDLAVGRFDAPPDDLLGASDDATQPSPLVYGRANPAELSVTASGLGRAVAVEVFDLDEDTYEDIVSVVNYSGYRAMWALNDAAGQFVAGSGTWPFGVLPSQVVAADFVGDSDVDLAFLEVDAVRFIEGHGDGSFTSYDPAQTFTGVPKRMVRFPDAAKVAVLLGVAFECNPCEETKIFETYGRDGTPLGSLSYRGFGAISPVAAVVGAVDGDAQLDLVLANGMGTGSSPPELLVATCWNGERFGRTLPLDAGGTPADVAVGDLNGDELADIVVAIPGTNKVSVLLSSSVGGR